MKHFSDHSTSWQKVGKWYNRLVGKEGSYYHQKVIIPKTIQLLQLKAGDSLFDLGCGQGVLSRHILPDIEYYGIDNARGLIEEAKKYSKNRHHHFIDGDITKPLAVHKNDFSHAVMILTLQNIAEPNLAIAIAANHLKPQGKILVVLNHPCFRIPRQSSWEIDKQNKTQYRRINRYLSPLRVPINIHPSQRGKNLLTWSFHYPLSFYTKIFQQNGFMILTMEEWSSDKESMGKASKMENRARQEFPLFLAILAKKSE